MWPESPSACFNVRICEQKHYTVSKVHSLVEIIPVRILDSVKTNSQINFHPYLTLHITCMHIVYLLPVLIVSFSRGQTNFVKN